VEGLRLTHPFRQVPHRHRLVFMFECEPLGVRPLGTVDSFVCQVFRSSTNPNPASEGNGRSCPFGPTCKENRKVLPMSRSIFTRAAGAFAAIAAVTFANTIARADEITQSELPTVVFVNGTSNGSQGFADIGAPSVNTGNVSTATTFTIGNMISTAAQTGYFTGLSSQIFGPVAFNPAVGSSLSFGNGTFGNFLSTSIVEQTNSTTGGSAERSFYVLGNYTAGTFNPALTPSPAPASLLISFTQTPAGTGAISDSATLSIPPAAVPEPSTLMLACVGIAGGIAIQQNRRHRRRLTAAAATQDDTSAIELG
jgi:hypothetical protein